ncbi:MAG: hypothetical protein K2R98_16655 [Gemmataceae bacterium]|nr:hypothetical protein [Gemmataceae bacterium]
MHTNVKAPWVVIIPMPGNPAPSPEHRSPAGDGREIVLQGFHWHSHRGFAGKSWYRIMQDSAERIKSAGFSWVWFPPSCDSCSPDGYMPRRWNQLNCAYGSEDELRGAIQALGPVKAMADVVFNHRVGAWTAGVDFEDPPFPNNRAAVTCDDDSGQGHGAPDTGECCTAGRDLDHTNHDVRNAIKNQMRRLKSVGFRGWRWDLAKGFHGRFIAEYNDATTPEFSVGEFYDTDRQKVTHWIDSTGGKSCAFDFPTRYLMYDALLRDDYSKLRSHNHGRAVPGGLIGYWAARSVTFLDNHDTEYRRDAEHQSHHNDTRHIAGRSVAMGYAYLLTHPGTPCVFWPHYFDWDEYTRCRIERMMQIRRGMGLHAASSVDIHEARKGLYAATIDGKVAVKIGAQSWGPSGGNWQLACDGEKFAVWTR